MLEVKCSLQISVTAASIDVGDKDTSMAHILNTGTPILTLLRSVGANIKARQHILTVTTIVDLSPTFAIISGSSYKSTKRALYFYNKVFYT